MPNIKNILRLPMLFLNLLEGHGQDKESLSHILFTSSPKGDLGPGLIGYLYLFLIRSKDLSLQVDVLYKHLPLNMRSRLDNNVIIYMPKIKEVFRENINDNVVLSNLLGYSVSDLFYEVMKIAPKSGIDIVRYKDEINFHLSRFYKFLSLNNPVAVDEIKSLVKVFSRLAIINLWLSYQVLLRLGIATSILRLNNETEKELITHYREEVWNWIFKIYRIAGFKREWLLSTIHFYPETYSYGTVSTKTINSSRGMEWICMARGCWLSKLSNPISNILGVEFRDVIRMPALYHKNFWHHLYAGILGYSDENVKVSLSIGNEYCRIRILLTNIEKSS